MSGGGPAARVARRNHDRVGPDLAHHRAEVRRDRPFLDPVLDVGPHPVLDRRLQRRRAMHDRDVRAGAIHLERRFGRRVAAADDDDALAVVGMRLAVIVVDVRQILAGHADHHRMIVVPDRHDDVAARDARADAARRSRLDREHVLDLVRPALPTSCPSCLLLPRFSPTAPSPRRRSAGRRRRPPCGSSSAPRPASACRTAT